MNTAHAASEPGSSATFEGSILVLFQAIVEKLRTGGDLNFTIAGAPVTLTQDNSTRRNLKIMFKVGSAQVGYAQLLSERYTQEQLERLGVKGQHYVYIARSAAPDTTIPRACAQLEHWKLPANAKPSDLLRKIIFEFTQLCKKYPLPRPVVQAAAEPHPGFDNSIDVVSSIANKFGTLVLRPQLDMRNIINNDIVWETPVKVRYGNCNLHVIALGVSGDCLFFVEQNNDGLVRRRAFELHEPTHQDQHQRINLRQITNSAEALDIKGADDNGSFSVDVDRNDPLNGTFRALALKALSLVQTAEMSNADTLTGLRTAVQAAGGVLERDGVRVTRNPGNKRGLHVAFKLEDGTWTRVESIGLNTQGSLTFSTPAHIHHLSVGRSPDKLMSDMAAIWKQEQQAHASVFAAAEPAPVTDFVAAIARHPGNRYRREIEGVLVVIGGVGPTVRAVVTDEKMPSAGNPNAAYNVVFDPTAETYQVSTSWDKQQRPFSKIPARSITGIDKLVDTIAVVVGRHASRVVFPRRRARARKNSS